MRAIVINIFLMFLVSIQVAESKNMVSKNISGGVIIYVDLNATGNNDGSDWANAFTSVQNAVNAAASGDEIRIAEGTYLEGAEILITLPMTLKGGYPTGGGVQNIKNYPTILSGNSQHRVINASHATGTLNIEGLTITEGGLTNDLNLFGAGIYSNGNIKLSQVIIFANRILDVASTGNKYGYGAGIFGQSEVVIIKSVVDFNRVMLISDTGYQRSKGGGIYAVNSITVINSKITNNSVAAGSSSSNAASIAEGGGLYSDNTVNILNSLIKSNFIEVSHLCSGPNDCNSSTNPVTRGGGAVGFITSNNSLIAGNTIDYYSQTGITNAVEGGGLYGVIIINNSTLWNNTSIIGQGVESSSEYFGSLTSIYSLIKGENPAGSGNIDATNPGFDPMFVDEVSNNFRLQIASPLKDSGNNSLLPLDDYDIDGDGNTTEPLPIDLDGGKRIFDTTIDIGPYEFQTYIGIAKQATVSGSEVTFDYYLENFSNLPLSNISLTDNLDDVFGMGNYTIITPPFHVANGGTITLNSGYDGSSDTNFFTAMNSTFSGLDTAQFRMVVDITNVTDEGLGLGNYLSLVRIQAEDMGQIISDVSDSGTDPDSNGNNIPTESGENDPTLFSYDFDLIFADGFEW
jgi:hypothetical protein